ncbi:MAG: permease-like cell division protein FtsX [Oscillospiraceae bacterium]|nr:permease-like cell division protein FtsX [Oscillospiraceae bacterium]
MFSHGLMSFAAVCMIVACLIIMGSFALVAVNADNMLGKLESENEFLAYIDEEYNEAQIEALMNRVRNTPNVAEVTFVSREEAKEAYLAGREQDGLYATLPDEVFRDRLAIRVQDLSLFNQTVNAVDRLEGVVKHRAEGEVAEGFVAVRNVATALATILVVILACVSLFIIANTIRLATFARREEIAIMKMCGATNGFVRWPFVVEGLLLGIFGAVIAFFLEWLIYSLVYRAVVQSGVNTLFTVIPFKPILPRILGAFVLGGVLIGAGGSGFAIRRFLRV